MGFGSSRKYDKLYNSIVRIEIKIEERIMKGTGFFMKSQIKGKQYKFLCTCYHVVSQQFVDSKIEISIYYGKKDKETKKIIKLDTNERFIKCFEKPKDVCLIEIIKSDEIPEDKFLIPDFNYKNGFNVYENENFYLAGYPRVNNQFLGERHISSGKIKEIKGFEFTHTLDTRSGSSGSPICLINNQNIIGIHRDEVESEHINYATFMGVILDDLEKDDEGNKSLNNDKKSQHDPMKDVSGKIIEEINIIKKEALIYGHVEPITKDEMDELYSYEAAICKIKFEISNLGTGFFCEINDDAIPFKKALFTNNHVLNEECIEKNKEIEFEYCKEKKKIKITENRKAFTKKELDYTCIEIFDTDNIKKFFKIDETVINNRDSLRNKDIFILQYPLGKLGHAPGIIINFKKGFLIHSASTLSGSSGSPLIKRYNLNVIIGIHNGEAEVKISGKETIYNSAISFDAIIKDLKDQISNKNINQFKNTNTLIKQNSNNKTIQPKNVDSKKVDEEQNNGAVNTEPNTSEKEKNSPETGQWHETCKIHIDENKYPDKEAPKLALKPIHIFGYREKDAHNNIKYIDNNSFLYPAGKIAVIQNISDKAQQYFIKHKRKICSLCVNNNRTIIATGEKNKKSKSQIKSRSFVKIWKIKALEEIAEFEIPSHGVSSMSFNLDGNFLAYCCLDEEHVVVINVEKNEKICEKQGGKRKIFSLAFKNNNEFATVGLNHYKFWIISENDRGGYNLIGREYENKVKNFDDKLNIISVMNDNFVTGSSLGYITLWKDHVNIKTAKCHDSEINCLYSDNNIIISGGNDKFLKVINKNLSILKKIPLESKSIINFSPRSIDILPGETGEKDIKNILLGTSSGDILELIFKKSIMDKESPEIKIYNSSCFSDDKKINEITSISFSKKLSLFVTTCEDKTIRFWNIFTKSQNNIININEEMTPTASNFSNEGNIFVVGFDNGIMRFYSTENICTMKKEFKMDNRKNPITVIKYNEQDNLLACATKDEKGNNVIDVYFWDSLNLFSSITGAENQINGLDWSKDGHFLAAYSHKKECRVFSILEKCMISEYEKVDYIEWNSWTLGYGWPLKGYYDDSANVPIYSCERFYVVYGNNTIVIGDINGAVKLYKYPIIDKEQKSVKHEMEHRKKITNVKYGKVGYKHIILTSSSDGYLIAWQIESI